jgi:DNA-binding MarR family transcriptional regulator
MRVGNTYHVAMTHSLQHELRQSKPFASLEAEAFLSIARTAAILETHLAEALKPHGLTPTQYNVLRILRGAGADGLCRYEVDDRLVTPGPDVTRLLDRLEGAGLVERKRDPADRRQVKARITPRGLSLLADLDEALLAIHRHQLGHLGGERLRVLIDILAAVREKS